MAAREHASLELGNELSIRFKIEENHEYLRRNGQPE
jgi:hypothetical protein